MVTLAAVKKPVLCIVALLVVAVIGIAGCGSDDEAIVESQINELVKLIDAFKYYPNELII